LLVSTIIAGEMKRIISPESVNEDQLRPAMQRQVRFVPFVDKRGRVRVKLCNPSTKRAIPERLCSEVPSL